MRSLQATRPEDKVVFEERGSDNYATVEVDSTVLNKQLEEWAANGLVKQDEVHWTKEEELAYSSLAGERVVEALKEANAPSPSRVRKKSPWTKDYVVN